MPNSDSPVRSGGTSAGLNARVVSFGNAGRVVAYDDAAFSRGVEFDRDPQLGVRTIDGDNGVRFERKLWSALSTNSAMANHGR